MAVTSVAFKRRSSAEYILQFGAPKVLNFVSKNFRDVNAREGLIFHFPSGHIPRCESSRPEQLLLKKAAALEPGVRSWQTFFSVQWRLFKPVTAIGHCRSLQVYLMVLGLPAKFANVNQKGTDQGAAG